MAARNHILVTGGGTFMGNHIAAALLAEGANITLLVRPGAEQQLGGLRDAVEWHHANVWNPASLRGRARGASMVIHTVGGTHIDLSQGLNYHYLNVLSFRNVANMCVTDGTPHIMLISTVAAWWLPRGYVQAKHEAETYIQRVGLRGTVVRAPLLYQRGKPRPPAFRIVSGLASVSPFFRRSAPLPVDVFARAVARIAVSGAQARPMYYANDLRRLNTREERKGLPATDLYPAKTDPTPAPPSENLEDTRPTRPPNR